MGIIRSIEGLVPPARYDGNAWVSVLIFESATLAMPGPQIDTIMLTPVDVDPSTPVTRSVTTGKATLGSGFYSVRFADAAGNTSDLTTAVQLPQDPNAMPPTAETILRSSPLLDAMEPSESQLQQWIAQSVANVQAITWRIIDPTLGCAAPEDYTCELLPVALVPVAMVAVVRMTERFATISQPQLAQQFATGRQLSGFGAGPYHESYFAPGEFMRRGVQTRPTMDPDDRINDALWALATEDAKDYFVWRNTGVAPPVGVASVFDYRRQTIGYGAGESALPGGFGRGGPDGF